MRWLLLPLAVALVACYSPEASRTRGGGPGGDTGNRPDIVRMHEGSRPYHEVDGQVPGGLSAVETASQARGFGRR
jgi:hypothetical protein